VSVFLVFAKTIHRLPEFW